MKNMRINYAMVGGFVLVMLVAMVVVVGLLTGRTGTADTYFTHFPNVTGIKYGSKVTYEGFVIGQVEDIIPLREADRTRFQLKLSVKRDWPIPKDSLARITSSGLLAAVIVDIRGGSSQAMLAPGSEIIGGSNTNLFAMMSDVAGQVTDLNQSALKPLLQTLNNKIEKLGGILEVQAPQLMANLVAVSGDLAQKTPHITADVERMTGTMSTKVVNDANARHISESLENLQNLTQGMVETRHKLDSAMTNLDKMVGGNRETRGGDERHDENFAQDRSPRQREVDWAEAGP